MLEGVAAQAADAAVKAFAEKQPEVKAGYNVEVTGDEADRALEGKPFKSGEFFKAVKNAAMYPSQIDQRLLPLKASGMNEAIPSQGGFLVTPDIASGIQQAMWGVGSILSLFNPITVSGNGLTINAIDETSRANGSRMGGVLGYWLEEGGTKTATKPKFRQIELKLKKVAAACYATDELLEDATALESWITNNVPDELRFQVEAAIINGNGVGKPLGILQSPALVSAVRTDASEIDALDVTRMWSLRYPGANDYVWFINANTTPQLYNMSIGQQPVFMPPGGLSGSQYGSLLGRPVIETEYNPGLGTLGDILLVSPSQYAMITKGGVQSASSIHVQFLTDETTFRFVYRVDGEPSWASAVTAYASTDSISPFVALAATT
jgi:HK97 family phage major capsid protein